MKITKGNIYGLIDQFRIGHNMELSIADQDRLAAMLTHHLTPDKSILEQREGMEKLITITQTKLNNVKENLAALQDSCPHDQTEPHMSGYTYDGMYMTKCTSCNKTIYVQGE